MYRLWSIVSERTNETPEAKPTNKTPINEAISLVYVPGAKKNDVIYAYAIRSSTENPP